MRSREFETLDAEEGIADELDRLGPRVEQQFVGRHHRIAVAKDLDQAHLHLEKTLLPVAPAERLLRPALEHQAALFVEARELDLGRDHLLRLDRHLIGRPEPFPRPSLESFLKPQHQEDREAREQQQRDRRADPFRQDPGASTGRAGTGARGHANQPVFAGR